MSTRSVLVLGDSHTGKTHFAGQLLGRLRHDRNGKFRLLAGGVDDLSKVEEVLSCLAEGRAAGHTPSGTWTGILCKLETPSGSPVVLEWPEYAGERLFSVVDQRALRDDWRESVRSAEAWVLFIRLSLVRTFEDILERPTSAAPPPASETAEGAASVGWDDQARYVELLQVFLFALGRSTYHPTSTPRLAVMLSCWDELGLACTPEEALHRKLPLLGAFLQSNWSAGAWSVWALSALGQSLSQKVPDPAFAEQGPEHFGFVIPPGSTVTDKDLTAPIAWLLGA